MVEHIRIPTVTLAAHSLRLRCSPVNCTNWTLAKCSATRCRANGGSNSRISADMPGVRPLEARGYADNRLSVLLRMRRLQDHPASEGGRLLRVLLLRNGEVSADAVTWLLRIDLKKDGARRICGVRMATACASLARDRALSVR